MPDFKIIAKVTNRLEYDPNAAEVFRVFVFRSLNENIYKYEEIDFDKSGDTGSATIVFKQDIIQNEEFLVCVTAFDDEGSMESWCKAEFESKVAIVTGAASGIGRATTTL